ncbi:hypothetical protein AAHS21_30265 [Mycobacterium sp. 050272]|uniref:hypothetical protein n=1 Tax=Mycobacteriaceae TaxID=1762 RepID=UPI0031942F02
MTMFYGASGDQSRAVVDRKPADIVNFSAEPAVTRLVRADEVAMDWNADNIRSIPFGVGGFAGRAQAQPEERQGSGRLPAARDRGRHAEPAELRHSEVGSAGALPREERWRQ